MFKNFVIPFALCASFFTSSADAGGIRAYPMNLSNVAVGVPSLIYVENNSDDTTFVTSYAESDNVMVYPPVIEQLAPGEKQAINVAFLAPPESSQSDYVIVKIGDGYNFKIGVRGN